ncbi:major facilitator superfamily domain-containing protein [Xylogone sp. PMI_703]|nr:major facilitator superfamily domain-containing protein [Xylogone sp. PMI_703]
MSQVSVEVQLQTFEEHHAPSSIISHSALATPPNIPNKEYSVAETLRDAESQINSRPTKQIVIAVAALAGVNLLSSLSTGLLTVGLPTIALDVDLSQKLLLWPTSVYSLTNGSCLLLAGSIADVVGHRLVNLIGCFIVGWFIIATGLAQTGIQLIMFRALQGVAVSLCFPTSVAIVANIIPTGRSRNIAFSCLGFVQPIGFSLGLVLEGLLLSVTGWRLGFYLCGGLSLLLFVVNLWVLPVHVVTEDSTLTRLRSEIDWIGAMMASATLALFSYLLSALANNASNIRDPGNIAILVVSVALVPGFIFWEHSQQKQQRPVLIPNSLWKNRVFTSICLMIIFSNAVTNAMEVFCSLFFQEVQNLSPLGASIRILPSLIVGVLVQITTGIWIHRMPAFYLVLVSLILNSGAPLLMAIINVHSLYWYNGFFAQLLAPLSCDILFTVGLLVVSEVFPPHTQALAGAIFNTVAQIGTSIGITIMAVIAASVTQSSKIPIKDSSEALMVGYRASFWAAFAWMVLACFIGVYGLRRIGKVGLKKE